MSYVLIQKKGTLLPDNNKNRNERQTVWENKEFAISSLNLYINAIQNLKANTISLIFMIVSITAIVVTI